MAANTKYQQAPQRDSFEESNYTQAPPSYQAEPSSHNALLGAPRSEDDNVPDDFKVDSFLTLHICYHKEGCVTHIVTVRRLSRGSHPSDSHAVRSKGLFHTVSLHGLPDNRIWASLTEILLYRSLQLLATIAVSSVSYFSTGYKNWIQSNPWLMWVSLFGALGFMLLTFWKRKSYPTNLIFLSGFTALEAYTISVVVSFYDTKIVLEALILTAGIFVALTLFACQTKYDFTSWMPYLFGGLWALILFGFMAAFFPYNSTAELIYGGVAALIFSGYILVDTQLIMRHYHVEEEIAAAISLYLDILNLFLAILRILNSQSRN